MRFYAQQALAPATRKAYTVGQGHFHRFCSAHARAPLPATERTLAEFIAYLADVVRCAPATIKLYLAAVRNMHVERGLGDPFTNTTLPDHVFRGVKRTLGTHARLQRLPVTLPVLRTITGQLRTRGNREDALTLAVACSLAFFAFMRSGELLALRWNDIQLGESTLTVRIPASKTDPFRRGCELTVGEVAQRDICPLGPLRLHARATGTPDCDRPLFVLSGQPLMRERFVDELQQTLRASGFQNCEQYKGHSFRIGAATTASQAGLPETLIKTLGRWTSSAYQTYIRTPHSTLAAVTATLSR